MIEKGFQTLLDMLAKVGNVPPGSMDEQRNAFKKLCAITDGSGPAHIATCEVVIPTQDGACGARLYTPKDAPPIGPGLLYFHGGGYVLGDLETHDALCRRLADQAHIKVLAVDYRLAPEHKFPAGHNDALDAAFWLRAHGRKVGIDSAHFAIGGDSAGGNLAAATAVALRDAGGVQPLLQVLLYPGFDPSGTESFSAFSTGYFLTAQAIADFTRHLGIRENDPQSVRVAPDVFAKLEGLPPAFVATGGLDPLRDSGQRYARKLRDAGVTVEYRDYPGFIHGFYTMANISAGAANAIGNLASALRAALGT